MRYLAAAFLAAILAVAGGIGAKAVFFNNLAVSGGVAPPAPPPTGGIVFNPTSVNFASQAAGTSSSPVAVTAQNIGASSLTVSSVNLTGSNPGDFSLTNNCGVLAPSGSCTVNVTYSPGAAGASAATVALTADVTPPPSTPTITVNGSSSGASVAAGATISVAVANGSANPTDWIGICSSSTFNHTNCDAQFDWDYLGSPCSKTQPSSGLASATCSMTAPASGGPYVAAFFQSGGYSTYATAPFTVTGGAPPVGCSADGTAGTRDMSQYPNGTGTATLDWTSCRQVWEGMGADAITSPASTSSFSTRDFDNVFTLASGDGGQGAGFNLTRLDEGYEQQIEYSPNPIGTAVTISAANCFNMQQIANRGGTIFTNQSTAPAAYLSGNSISNFAGVASWMASYVNTIKTQCGITVVAQSLVNEPDLGTLGMNDGGASIHSLVAALPAAYASAGVNPVPKIMIPESSDWNFSLATNTMSGSDASKVGQLAIHYGNTTGTNVSPYPYQNLGLHLWHTESNNANSDSGWTDLYGPLWNAYEIGEYAATGNINAWEFLSMQSPFGDCRVAELLDCPNHNPTNNLYAFGQFSRFVRPGWHLYGATQAPISGRYLNVTFWRSPSTNAFAVVVSNYDGGSASVTFNFSGFTAPSVIPTITDASRNWAQQSSVSAGSGFSYTIPSQAIVTFTGTAN